MKRNLDLIRDILFSVEGAPAGSTIGGIDFPDHDQMEISEHVQLLLDDGYIEGKVLRPHGIYAVTRLTARGHDFLDNARNSTVWKQVLHEAKEKGMSTSMTILNKLLEGALKKYAGIE